MNAIAEAWMIRSERWMYRDGHPNRLATILNRLWAVVGARGLGLARLVTLEVVGRRTGSRRSVPLIVAALDGERYLVAMLGERADWVANVRAAGGQAILRDGRSRSVHLEEVEPALRAPIIRRHLELAPAARSFVPIDRHAPPAAFESVADAIPVFRIQSERGNGRTDPEHPAIPVPDGAEHVNPSSAGTGPSRTSRPADATAGMAPGRRRLRHWRRWLLVALASLIVLVPAATAAFLAGAPSPLALPVASAAAPTGTLEGAWTLEPGSLAGFRIRQTILGMTGDIAARTSSVTGSVAISGTAVEAAEFTVDLRTIMSGGRSIPQLQISLETDRHPLATVRLEAPLELPSSFVNGSVVKLTARAMLGIRGQTRQVTVSLTARRDGSRIEAVGTIPVAFADFGIEGPTGYGPIGSLADQATAEFLLVLVHS